MAMYAAEAGPTVVIVNPTTPLGQRLETDTDGKNHVDFLNGAYPGMWIRD